MDEFILRALVGVILLASMLGPLGAFVVWRHMSYFGDTIAHSALLGVALSLLSGSAVPIPLAMFLVAIAVALLLTRYTRDSRFHADTVLGILAHSALAIGVLLVAMSRTIQVDINLYLFGDILGITWQDVAALAVLAAVVLTILSFRWRALLMVTIEPNIAAVEGIRIARVQLLFTVMLAAVIALAIKLTGVLLITALLIIPAAAARYLAASPKQMAMLASAIGIGSASVGLFTSLAIDAPTGPMMVVAAAVSFVLCGAARARA
jgi:zinc transport system permease protein